MDHKKALTPLNYAHFTPDRMWIVLLGNSCRSDKVNPCGYSVQADNSLFWKGVRHAPIAAKKAVVPEDDDDGEDDDESDDDDSEDDSINRMDSEDI